MVNLDDFNLWVQTCKHYLALFKKNYAYGNGDFGHWIQMKFNEKMCLLGIKEYYPFQVLVKKHIFHKKEFSNEFFCNFLFITFKIALICHMFFVNHF